MSQALSLSLYPPGSIDDGRQLGNLLITGNLPSFPVPHFLLSVLQDEDLRLPWVQVGSQKYRGTTAFAMDPLLKGWS